MAAKAVLDLVSNDSRFLASMSRVKRAVMGIEARMAKVASSAKRMLLIGGAAIAGFLVLAAGQIAAETKLEAVLKATGNAAGLSAKQLKAHAAALQNVTGVGDETIIAMQAVLATFKEIKGDQFIRTTEAIVDMATVLKMDLQSAAIQVGKALNDPIRGVSMLSRAGVTFSESQLKMIKSLAKSGDLMGAQKIVLEELESQFGGTAEAIGKTFVGSMKKATSAIGDVGEEIGNVFIPFVMRMADAVTGSKDRIIAWVAINKALILTITGITTTLAVLTIGIHLMTKAIVAATAVVAGLSVGFAFLAAHPILIAIGLLATAVVALILEFRKAEEVIDSVTIAADKLIASNKELALSITEVSDAKKADSMAAERDLVFQEERLRILDEEKKKRGALLKIEEREKRRPERERERLRGLIKQDLDKPRDLFDIRPVIEPLVGPMPKPFGPQDLRVPAPILFDKISQLSNRIKKAWDGLVEASKKVNANLDIEAARIKSMVRTDQERLAIELKRIALLQASGRLSAEEARRARVKLTTEEGGVGVAAIEDAASMFRRIQAAAGGRRMDAPASPQQQTAVNTTKTAAETSKTAAATTKSAGVLDRILDLLNDVADSGLKTQAVYGS